LEICRQRPPPPAGGGHRVLRNLGVGCAREPATVRVLSVNSSRLLPKATKSASATSRNSRQLPARLGRCRSLRLVLSLLGSRTVTQQGPNGTKSHSLPEPCWDIWDTGSRWYTDRKRTVPARGHCEL